MPEAGQLLLDLCRLILYTCEFLHHSDVGKHAGQQTDKVDILLGTSSITFRILSLMDCLSLLDVPFRKRSGSMPHRMTWSMFYNVVAVVDLFRVTYNVPAKFGVKYFKVFLRL